MKSLIDHFLMGGACEVKGAVGHATKSLTCRTLAIQEAIYIRGDMHARLPLKLVAPLGILGAGWFFIAQELPAKPDYTRRTRKDCEFCHPPNSRRLTEAGQYFQEHKNSLAGFVPKEQAEQSKKKSAAPGKAQ